MTRTLTVLKAGPGVTVQDGGRPGMTGLGLSRGGAADRMALAEAEALLGPGALIEFAGNGLRLRADAPVRVAVLGGAAGATVDGRRVAAYGTVTLSAGETLDTPPPETGSYGYLAVAGGVATKETLGGRGAHLLARIGGALAEGDVLPLGDDPDPDAPPLRLTPDRPGGGAIRVMPGPQTALFPPDALDRFAATAFTRSPRGNRQGVKLDHGGDGFRTEGQRALVSDFIAEGDIQMTGDGRPFVLLPEHQTTGGYPRIGTVIPADMPRVAQALPGADLRFTWIGLDDAARLHVAHGDLVRRLKSRVERSVLTPDAATLLRLNLIGGVTAGEEA